LRIWIWKALLDGGLFFDSSSRQGPKSVSENRWAPGADAPRREGNPEPAAGRRPHTYLAHKGARNKRFRLQGGPSASKTSRISAHAPAHRAKEHKSQQQS